MGCTLDHFPLNTKVVKNVTLHGRDQNSDFGFLEE